MSVESDTWELYVRTNAELAALKAESEHITFCNSDLTAENTFLLDKLTGKNKRLEKAEELLRAWRHVTYKSMIHLQDQTDTFLSLTPAPDPEEGVDFSQATLVQGKKMVLVRREDVEKAIDFIENTGGVYWREVANRLKAASEGGKP
jgi:hypothetical protein